MAPGDMHTEMMESSMPAANKKRAVMPKGHHLMPDGSMMKDSEMKSKRKKMKDSSMEFARKKMMDKKKMMEEKS